MLDIVLDAFQFGGDLFFRLLGPFLCQKRFQLLQLCEYQSEEETDLPAFLALRLLLFPVCLIGGFQFICESIHPFLPAEL